MNNKEQSATTYPIIFLKKGRIEALDRRHPWIFSGAIESSSRLIEEGEFVDVYDADNHFLCRGYSEIGSIAVRILSFRQVALDRDFFKKKLLLSWQMRKDAKLIRENNTIFRLVHGEGDFLPGLVIDVYGSVAVVQAHTVGMHLLKDLVAELLLDAPFNEKITSVYYKSDTTLPFKADITFKSGLIGGEKFSDFWALENGIKIFPDILHGQKTGFFIDQRDNRSLLKKYSRNKSVLNMFCYTGGFSLAALCGGARRVVSVDSSSKAIDLTLKNVQENQNLFERDLSSCHQAVTEDAFKYLEGVDDGEFDIVILDPPAFAKHRQVLKNALKGYRRLNALAMSKMKAGSILFTFSCSQAVSDTQFRQSIFTAALQAQKQIKIMHQLYQPCDHPVSLFHPEGEYLKGLVLYIDE